MCEVIRYIGGAGTGKTTTLLDFVHDEHESHQIGLHDLLFLSFTRSQRDEVRERIGVIFPDSHKKDIERRVKTIHGAALSSCIAAGFIQHDPDQSLIITEDRTPESYDEFCRGVGHIPYDSSFGDLLSSDDDSPVRRRDVIPAGNALFSLARFITRQHTWKPEHWMYASEYIGIPFARVYGDVPSLIRQWKEFKRERGLYEHDDYITVAIEKKVVPHARVIYIDEFQDVSPAQYVLFKLWRDSGSVERIYIAGDPNQTIYGFRGSDPSFLVKTPAIDRGASNGGCLPKSYRCPSRIIEIADRILGDRSNMTPAREGGYVGRMSPKTDAEFIDRVDELYQSYGKVFILSRYLVHVRKLSNVLTMAGMPHSSLTPRRIYGWEYARTSVTDRTVDLNLLLKALRSIYLNVTQGYPWTITPDEAHILISALKMPDVGHRKDLSTYLKNHTHVDIQIDEFLPHILGDRSDRDPFSIVTNSLDLSIRIKSRLVKAVRRKTSVSPLNIVVDTIHAAKGLESPAVILHTGYLSEREIDIIKSARIHAEERRVYYVGCTRSSDALFFLDDYQSEIRSPILSAIVDSLETISVPFDPPVYSGGAVA